jgi:hypothetical protein
VPSVVVNGYENSFVRCQNLECKKNTASVGVNLVLIRELHSLRIFPNDVQLP